MSVLHPSLYYDLLGQPSKLYPAPPHFGSSSLSSNPFLQVSCVFVHVHVHVDTCMQPAIWIVRCLCMWKGGQHWLSFSIAFIIIEAENPIDPEAYRFFLPGWAVRPRNFIHFPEMGSLVHMIETGFDMGLRSELKNSSLCGRHFTDWDISRSLCFSNLSDEMRKNNLYFPVMRKRPPLPSNIKLFSLYAFFLNLKPFYSAQSLSFSIRSPRSMTSIA